MAQKNIQQLIKTNERKLKQAQDRVVKGQQAVLALRLSVDATRVALKEAKANAKSSGRAQDARAVTRKLAAKDTAADKYKRAREGLAAHKAEVKQLKSELIALKKGRSADEPGPAKKPAKASSNSGKSSRSSIEGPHVPEPEVHTSWENYGNVEPAVNGLVDGNGNPVLVLVTPTGSKQTGVPLADHVPDEHQVLAAIVQLPTDPVERRKLIDMVQTMLKNHTDFKHVATAKSCPGCDPSRD